MMPALRRENARYKKENTIRDGGGTALYAAYTVDTVDTVGTIDMVDTVDMVDNVDMLDNVVY